MTVIRRAQGPWVLVAATSLWASWRLWAESDGGLALPEAMFALLCAAIIGGMTLVLGVRVLRARLRDRVPLARAVSRPVRVYGALVLLVFLLTRADVPLAARLALSSPALTRAAAEAQTTRGGLPQRPGVRIGWFSVKEIIPAGDEVRFGTADCGLDFCGVVHRAAGGPERRGAITYTRVYGGWWRWHERW